MVTESVKTYVVVEEYSPNRRSQYLPGCLIYAEHGGEPVHILFALDRNEDHVRVITVYRPDPDQWEPGFRQRRTA